jgi:hypothetical protein
MGLFLWGAALSPAPARAGGAPAAPADAAPRVEPAALSCSPGEPLSVRVIDPVAGPAQRSATCPPCGAEPEVRVSFLIDRPNGDRGHAVLRTTPAPCGAPGARLGLWGPLAAVGLLLGGLTLLRSTGPR